MDEKKDLTPEQQKEVQHQWEVLQRGTVEIVPEEDLKQKIARSIQTDTPLKVKLGLDPTAPDIHVGHTVVIQKLRQFQDFGHQVQLILGDFTARVGDPTGKSETRKPLTSEEVKANAKTYLEQYSKILDMSKTELYYNSEWLVPLQFEEVLQLAGKMTVARMLERDDFEQRYRANQAISLHEFFYPLMQAYDSVALKSDVELGGTDQKFNLLMGRHVQKEYGHEPQVAMTTPLLEGLDGVQKMSKSLGNYIGIDEDSNQIYGKTMSVPDDLMLKYYEMATDIPFEAFEELKQGLEKGTVHPRDAKMRLARTFVRMYHGEEEAKKAEQQFTTIFQKGNMPDEMPEHVWTGDPSVGIVTLIAECNLVPSKGEGRRMVQQGAVKVNGEKVDEIHEEIHVHHDMIVQVGKRKFVQLKVD